MEEIKLDTEPTQKKKSTKNIWLIVIVSIVACLASYFAFDALLNTDSTPKLNISGCTLSVEYNEYLGYSTTIKGLAKNNSKKNYSYASVEFSVYDSAGNNLGTALANINNLASGDSWSFEASLFSFTSTRPTSFKLVEINAW